MTRRAALAIAAFYAIGIVLVFLIPQQLVLTLVIMAPLLVIGGIVSVVYLDIIYRQLLPPRPQFFAMLIHAKAFTVIATLWFLYVAIAQLFDFIEIWHPEINLPDIQLVPQPYRSSVTTLSIAILMLPVIYYAVRIYLARRRAGREGDDDAEGTD